MKLLALPFAVASLGLLFLPAILTNGDAAVVAVGCGVGSNDPTLATIRAIESSGNYTIQNTGSTASGAYQFLDSTWANYAGYPRAWLAPPAVQDAMAAEQVAAILAAHAGDVTTVPVVWYIGYVPATGSADWDAVPYLNEGNVLTPRQYQTMWLTEYAKHTSASISPSGVAGVPTTVPPVCSPGPPIAASAAGYAYPGPWDLFQHADVNAPHAEYPAWDWLIPVGTPIYAVRGGTVTTVQYWPFNWWDHGCGTNPTGCHSCGIGITIVDSDGTHWAYCHGTAAHVHEGDLITAGTRILTSGNTGRSGAPHLHIEITTPDGLRHCPDPILTAVRNGESPAAIGDVTSVGCFY